jgi:hypothetical protein
VRSSPRGSTDLVAAQRVVTIAWVRHRPRHLLSATLFAVLAIAGCGGGDDPVIPPPDAAAYAAAMVPFLPVADPEESPKVFVAPFDEPLSLEEQVAVIDTIGEGYDVTFADDAETVVDADAEGYPVKDEALLLIVGTLPADPPYVARVESYRNEREHTASLVTLVWRSDHWAVASEEPVEPEAVIVAE